jgi:hypothetical protein
MSNFSVLLAGEGLSRAFRIHEWDVDKCLMVWQDCGQDRLASLIIAVYEECKTSNQEANTNNQGDNYLHVQTPLRCP